jgi:hypothetical protein
MNFKTTFSEIFKNLLIFISVFILIFPVNILISFDNQISITFVELYDYAYLFKHFYLVMPSSFLLIPFVVFFFISDFIKFNLFSNQKTLFFLIYIIITTFLIIILSLGDFNIRLIKNFISSNILIFLLFYSKVLIQNFSEKTIRKAIYISVYLIFLTCIFNLFHKTFFYDNSFDLETKTKLFLNFNLSHYQDYFPYLVFILLGIVIFSDYIFNKLEKFLYSTIFLLWFFESLIFENKGLLLVFIFSFLSFLILRIDLLKSFILKNLYLFYLPLIIYLIIAVYPIFYGFEPSIDDRIRALSRNYHEIQNILFFPVLNKTILSNYANTHNDFVEIFTLYGIFCVLIFQMLFLRIRKLLNHNFIFGFMIVSIYFLGSIVQNNMLNPYLLIIICLILGTNTKIYLKRI